MSYDAQMERRLFGEEILWLAFGSLEFLPGEVIGKAWMVVLSIPLIAWLRRRDEWLGITLA